MNQSNADLDRRVRRFVYDVTLRRGTPPTLAASADGLGTSLQQIAASFQRLAAGRVLVLARDSGEILMANPFSAVPTPFLVEFEDYACYGNCIWDAMGTVAMRGRDARIKTSCGDCGAPMEVRIVSQALQSPHGVAHYALPARRWWDDIVFN
jgi:hypothetical protein